MRIESVSPEAASGELGEASYRVLLWNQPPQRGGAWALDEWDIHDASDVQEVVQWAEQQESASYEIAVRWQYTRFDVDGEPVMGFRYTRVAGSRGAEDPTIQVVRSTAIG